MRPHRWIGWSAALAVACSGGAATGPTLAHVTEPAPQPVPVERADPDDVEGLARELGVAELRAGAVAYLRAHYDRALRVADSDHDAEGPTAVAAQVSEALVAAYVDEEDPELGLVILQLLVEMRAPDAWPALERALDWRRESTEEHAIIAAQAMEDGLADDARAEARATAAAEALTRIEGTRGVDNRMRIHLLRALGAIGHPASRRGLTTVAERVRDDQNFLINRLALEQLAGQADPSSVPTMIRALYLWARRRPDMRMNDIAAQGLVQIGRPALQPLLDLLAGRNAEANAVAQRYVEAIRELDAQTAAQISAEGVVAAEACYALGQLGFVEALAALLVEARHADASRRHIAAVSLVSLSGLSEAQVRTVRQTLQRVYDRGEPMHQLQILVAIQHTYDAGHLPFLLRVARDRDAPMQDHRLLAVRAHALLANARESRALRRVIRREPPDDPQGLRENMQERLLLVEEAARCDEDLACWQARLAHPEPDRVRKALHMLCRLGASWPDVRDAVLPLIAHSSPWVRGDALYAIDHLSADGDQAVVDRIDRLREDEEGRSSWNQVSPVAMAIRARQLTRIGAQP